MRYKAPILLSFLREKGNHAKITSPFYTSMHPILVIRKGLKFQDIPALLRLVGQFPNCVNLLHCESENSFEIPPIEAWEGI